MTIEKELKSTAIKKIKYDSVNQTLSVTFTSDSTYDYPGVPPTTVEGLVTAESAGKYFNKYIRPYSAK